MGLSTNYPLVNADNIFDFVNNWTKVVNRHSVKWGVDIRRLRLERAQPQGLDMGPRGLFRFTPSTTALRDGPDLGPYSFGNAFAAFLLGATDRVSRTYMTLTPTNRQTEFFTFINDTFRVTPRLTLDLGLRYEIYTPIKPRYARGASNYDPVTNSPLIAGVGSVDLATGVQLDTTDFAPRVGIAYRISDKSVIRAGYGISYFTGRYGFTGGTLSTQWPVINNFWVGVSND